MNGFDVFNGRPLMEQDYTALPQPSFGQAWSPMWNNSPWPEQNFNMSFPLGLPPNAGFVQNQQIEVPDYDENDDFYGHESRKPEPSLSVTTGKDTLSTSSLAPQNGTIASGDKQGLDKATTPVPQKLLQGQVTNQGNSAIKSPTPNHMLKLEANTRAAELRAKLLASKRGGSATPQPTASSDEPVSLKPIVDASHMDRNTQNTVMKQHASVSTSGSVPQVIGISLAQSKLQPIVNPVRATRVPSADTDVDGLINEYRASEAIHSPSLTITPDITASKIQANLPVNQPANKLQSNGRAINVNTSIPHATSPESSESGEIRSDQDLEVSVNGPDENGSTKNPGSARPQKNAEAKETVARTEQSEKPQTPQEKPNGPKQSGSHKSFRNAPLSTQKPDISKSTQPRPKVPVAPGPSNSGTELPRDEASLPLASNNARADRPPKSANTDKADSGRFLPAKSSPSIRSDPPPPRRPSRIETEVRRDRREVERNSNEERARLYKEKLAEKRQPPSSINALSDVGKNGSLTEPASAISLTQPVDPPAPDDSSPKQVEAPETMTNAAEVTVRQEEYVLNKAQLERLQEMGIDLSLEGLSNLSDFLEYHRFYVGAYREGFFARQRRMRALEEEKAALERESLLQYDHFNSMRAISTPSRGKTEPPTTAQLNDTKHVFATPSAKPMPPPLTLPPKTANSYTIAIQGRDSANGTVQTMSPLPQANGTRTHQVNSPNDELRLKRHHADDDDHGHTNKIARITSDMRPEYRSHQISPMTSRTDDTAFDRRRSSEYRPSNFEYRGRSRSPEGRRRSYSPYRRGSDPAHFQKQEAWSRSFSDGRNRGAISPNVPSDDRNYNRDRDEPAFLPHQSQNGSIANYRGGGHRGGRGGYQGNKPRHGFSGYSMSPAPHGTTIKGSASLNLKAGGQSHSVSSSVDRP
ncbi:MAG: hypothetical protein Q9220_005038 [cf. Caloplaca sp. 1 TL-2023]